MKPSFSDEFSEYMGSKDESKAALNFIKANTTFYINAFTPVFDTLKTYGKLHTTYLDSTFSDCA